MTNPQVTFGTHDLGAALTAYADLIADAVKRAGPADPQIEDALDGVARIAALLTANPDVRLAVPEAPGDG